MTNVTITLPDTLQMFVDQQAAEHGFETCGEYIEDLIRRQQELVQFRQLILEGMNSPPAVVADDQFFDRTLQRLDALEAQ